MLRRWYVQIAIYIAERLNLYFLGYFFKNNDHSPLRQINKFQIVGSIAKYKLNKINAFVCLYDLPFLDINGNFEQ